MAKIIKQRERKSASKMELCFYRVDTGEVCYGFPMVDGEVKPVKEGVEINDYTPCTEEECTWWKNYQFVKNNDMYFSRVEECKFNWVEPAIAICECGKEITLDYDAQECEHCGRLHNLFGQELLPRHMWGRDY